MSASPIDILRKLGPEQLAQAKKAADRILAERHLHVFAKQGWRYLDPAPFIDGWHLEAVAEHLEAISRGQIRNLIINQPPRTMKSILTSVAFSAWTWAQKSDPNYPLVGPGVQFLTASYAQSLSLRDSVKCRRLIESPWYQSNWGDRFKLTDDQNTKIRFENDKGGYRLATSVGGALTGEGGSIIIVDDGHNTIEAESDAIRRGTLEWWDEALSTRLNDPKTGAYIIVMQRLHEEDLTGHILSKDNGSFTHLMLPMRFDTTRVCVTDLGFEDPREEDGELLWPERFGEVEVEALERALGPYATASQLQQSPSPRGGGIIKREFWQLWEGPLDAHGREQFPMLEYVVGYLDTAFTEKQENDYCAMSVWGLWLSKDVPKLILLNAWQKHLTLHGPMFDESEYPGWAGMSKAERDTIMRKHWGVCEWANHTAKRFNCDTLLIENKANGIDVANEFRRLYRDAPFSVQLDDPGRRDKVARAHAVVPMFADKMIYAPDRDWAELAISLCANFPKIAHDDLVDTVTGALLYFRRSNLAALRSERLQEEEALKKYRPKSRPLYPV